MAQLAMRLPGGGCTGPKTCWKPGALMKLLKTLTNPFLLGAQGFLAGAVIFFATHPDAGPQRDAPSSQHAKAETARTRA